MAFPCLIICIVSALLGIDKALHTKNIAFLAFETKHHSWQGKILSYFSQNLTGAKNRIGASSFFKLCFWSQCCHKSWKTLICIIKMWENHNSNFTFLQQNILATLTILLLGLRVSFPTKHNRAGKQNIKKGGKTSSGSWHVTWACQLK